MNKVLKSKGASGFTLVETVIALALVSTLIYASLYIASESARAVTTSIRQNQSQSVLQNFAEETLGNLGTNPDLTATGTNATRFYDQHGNLVTQGPLELSWEVTPNSPITNILKIDLEAQWLSSLDPSRKLTVYRPAPPDPIAGGILLLAMPVPAATHIFSWQYSAWTDCDLASHTSTRVKSCYDETSRIVVTPSTPCNGIPSSPVIASCGYSSWMLSDWGTCSGGTRTRSVDCVDGAGAKLPDSHCSMFVRPPSSQSCVICNPYC